MPELLECILVMSNGLGFPKLSICQQRKSEICPVFAPLALGLHALNKKVFLLTEGGFLSFLASRRLLFSDPTFCSLNYFTCLSCLVWQVTACSRATPLSPLSITPTWCSRKGDDTDCAGYSIVCTLRYINAVDTSRDAVLIRSAVWLTVYWFYLVGASPLVGQF